MWREGRAPEDWIFKQAISEWDRWRHDSPLWYNIKDMDYNVARAFDYLCRIVGKSITNETDEMHDRIVIREQQRLQLQMEHHNG